MNRKNWILWATLLLPAALVPIGNWHFRSTIPAPATGAVSAERLMPHIRYLASDELEGRLAGSPGAEKAARYIAEQFARRNLLPLGDEGSYFQEFSFVSGVRLGSANALEVAWGKGGSSSHAGGGRDLEPGSDFTPVSFSLSGQFEGAAQFVGYGISAPSLQYDDYRNRDVKGKFVFALRYGPEGDDPHGQFGRYHALRYKAQTARDRGATGIVFVNDSEDFSGSSLSKLRFDRSFADSGIAALAISRPSARRILAKAGLNLDDLEETARSSKGSAADMPGVRLKFRADLVKETRSARNVVGFLKGKGDLAEEVLAIGAHFDHLGMGEVSSLAAKPGSEVHNGADDNASGTAGLLELAGTLASRKDQPGRGVLFLAFSGEEQGLLGSRHYVNHPVVPLEKTVAMINMDMIGRMQGTRLIVGGTGSSPGWKDLLTQLNEDADLELKYREGGFGPSDHSSFYGRDIPVLFFFTGVHGDYHKPSDDYDKIEPDSIARVVEFIFQTARSIRSMEQRPAFRKTAGEPRESGRTGFRVTLGIIPDYGEEVEGVRLTGVREGSPASKCGLRSGDLIVGWSGKKITNIYDLTYLLQEHRPGDEVEISVVRDGREMSFTATLEGR